MSKHKLEFPASVYQAQGIVSEQADCSLDDALELMKKSAKVTDEELVSIAEEVIGHKYRFKPVES